MHNYVYYKCVIVCVYFVCTPIDNLRMGVVTNSLIPRPSDWGEEGGVKKAWYPLHAHVLHFPCILP